MSLSTELEYGESHTLLERVVRLETRQQFVLDQLTLQNGINKELAAQRSAIWGYLVGCVGLLASLITLIVYIMRGKG